jgi:predicted esterase
MGQGLSRRQCGAKLVVCLGFVLAAFALVSTVAMRARAESSAKSSAAPIVIEEVGEEPGSVVYPARSGGARPITVALHGMCSEPERACQHFAGTIAANENLICPRARMRCDGGGSIWPAAGFVASIEGAIERAKARLPAAADESKGRTLIGYSLGAFRALALAEQGGGRYPRVMLIGARIYPNRARLANNGVERLLLTAGRFDRTHEHMRREAARLERAGFRARFLGLGPVGHFFTPSFAEYLPGALEWLHAVEPAAVGARGEEVSG